MPKISAVLFDLDGLLVDSEPLQASSWDEYAQRHGKRMTADVIAHMIGRRPTEASAVAVELLELPVSPEQALAERNEIFMAAVPGAIHPQPGAIELLALLDAHNIHAGLVTSGHRQYVDLALESAGLSGRFEREVTAEDITRGKPFPDPYLKGAELLGVAPAHCLALEDAPMGITSAIAAGMACFAVPEHGMDPAAVVHATAVLESLHAVWPELKTRGWA